MAKQLTVGELASKAITLISAFTEEAARNFLKVNNIRSETKLNTLAQAVLDGTDTTDYAAAVAPAAQKAASTNGGKTKAPANKPAAKKSPVKGARAERTPKIVEAGPRGFRFGEVWNQSVKDGSGVAFNPANINKLLAQAKELAVGEATIESGDVAKIAKAIAGKLEKAAAKAEAEA